MNVEWMFRLTEGRKESLNMPISQNTILANLDSYDGRVIPTTKDRDPWRLLRKPED